MTKEETERFYQQNKRKYCIKENKPFLAWLNKIIDNGYDAFLNIDELQSIINNIATWYEIKYPERQLTNNEDNQDLFEIKKLSKHMNIKQLLYRLTSNQVSLIRGKYRSNNTSHDVYDNKGKVVGQRSYIYMSITQKNNKDTLFYPGRKIPVIRIYADDISGNVEINSSIEKYVYGNNTNLDQLLELFKSNYNNVLELTKLERCIYNHKCDLELRNGILQLVALKLLYSIHTTPEIGYKRAIKFIDEFNKKLYLCLSKDEINEIFNRNYKVKKMKKSFFAKVN